MDGGKIANMPAIESTTFGPRSTWDFSPRGFDKTVMNSERVGRVIVVIDAEAIREFDNFLLTKRALFSHFLPLNSQQFGSNKVVLTPIGQGIFFNFWALADSVSFKFRQLTGWRLERFHPELIAR